MPNTLHEKALRQPFRVGLMLGALLLPTLWVASQDVIRIALGKRWLDSEQVTGLFAWGFLPGMILGAGALCAWAAWRAGKVASARWSLIGNSLLVILLCFAFAPFHFSSHPSDLVLQPPREWDSPFIGYAFTLYDIFPLQCALVTLLFGLSLRSSRA